MKSWTIIVLGAATSLSQASQFASVGFYVLNARFQNLLPHLFIAATHDSEVLVHFWDPDCTFDPTSIVARGVKELPGLLYQPFLHHLLHPELDPPAIIGRRFFRVMASTACSACRQKSAAVKSAFGSTTPSRWWGTPWHSSSLTLLVTMSRPLYTCILSEFTTSATKRVARSMANRDFPVPVAPITITTLSFRRRLLIFSPPWQLTMGCVCLQKQHDIIILVLCVRIL
nr:unnamed protein product [Ipomoea trifida]